MFIALKMSRLPSWYTTESLDLGHPNCWGDGFSLMPVIYMYVYIYIYIVVYKYFKHIHNIFNMCMYVYIYIYMCVSYRPVVLYAFCSNFKHVGWKWTKSSRH